MFGPKDTGLKLPLQCVAYHGRHAICDAQGYELFLIEVVRPSLEAKQWIEEWGQAICEKFNNGNQRADVNFIQPDVIKEGAKVEDVLDQGKIHTWLPDTKIEDNKKVEIIKRGRGRPKGSMGKKWLRKQRKIERERMMVEEIKDQIPNEVQLKE